MHENAKELEMLEKEYFPLPESESSPPKDTSDSESSEDDNDVLPLRSGKKRVTFSRKKNFCLAPQDFSLPPSFEEFFLGQTKSLSLHFSKGKSHCATIV